MNFGEIEVHDVCLTLDYMPDYLKDVEAFLDSDYGKSLKLIRYSCVDYLKDVSVSLLGVFAKCDINSKFEIPGLTGYLVDIKEDEITPRFNDFSVTESSRLGVRWLVLGLISFVNESCRPNVAYVNVKNLMFVYHCGKKSMRRAYKILSKQCFWAEQRLLSMSLQKITWILFFGISCKAQKSYKKNKGNDLEPNPINRFSEQGFPSCLSMFFPWKD